MFYQKKKPKKIVLLIFNDKMTEKNSRELVFLIYKHIGE